MVNPAAYASRIGPQIPPHLLMPGTATSGAQATPMSEREFSSLLADSRRSAQHRLVDADAPVR
ncbi:hypothetical protein GS491_24140 [Rhodococcus hoagii]|nr:hypothetical protein [Prescottella equi]